MARGSDPLDDLLPLAILVGAYHEIACRGIVPWIFGGTPTCWIPSESGAIGGNSCNTTNCPPPGVCVNGSCAQPPAGGCSAATCPSPGVCVSGVCAQPLPSCDPSICPPPLVCVQSVCTNPNPACDPTTCPAPYVCLNGICGLQTGGNCTYLGVTLSTLLCAMYTANPNIIAQGAQWRNLRCNNFQDPNDWGAFEVYQVQIGAPDPGPTPPPEWPTSTLFGGVSPC